MKINILTNNSCPNSRAFNCPLFISKKLLADKNIYLSFHFKHSKKIFESDVLFINSNVFREHWGSDKELIFNCCRNAKEQKQKVIWLDTTDSTWSTQLEILPYVDRFLKNQIFSDINQYLVKYKTGRVFTDFFNEIYDVEESEYSYSLPEKNQLHKIGVSWAPCFENYNEFRYSFSRKIQNLCRPLTANLLTETLNLKFTKPSTTRTQKISARFGLSHSRVTVVAHRKAVIKILEELDVDCSRIPLEDYFDEMRNSQISLSPYGVGEFCYRDYESIICGATLLKPDMSHMTTWPNFYQADKFYISHKWDLSDLKDKLDYLMDNQDYCMSIAEQAQKFYKSACSIEGMEQFTERIINVLN
jgi:hypothetical protein